MDAEIKSAAEPVNSKSAAIKAWNDAADLAEKTAAVKQFPILVELYALAANLTE